MSTRDTAGIEAAIGEIAALVHAVKPMLSDSLDRDAISDAGYIVDVIDRLIDELQLRVEGLRQ